MSVALLGWCFGTNVFVLRWVFFFALVVWCLCFLCCCSCAGFGVGVFVVFWCWSFCGIVVVFACCGGAVLLVFLCQ